MKRLLFIVLILACSAWTQTHTEVTLEDNQTLTSQKTISNAGTFAGSQIDAIVTSILNSASILTEYQANQGSTHTTEALDAAMIVSLGASKHQFSANAGYANTKAVSSPISGSANTVSGYFACRVTQTRGHAGVQIR